MTTSCLHYFSGIGFLKEKPIALKLLKNVSEILSADNVAYCLMFGTLLGKLRHDDFIPWDDDIDIIIFDVEKFESLCIKKLKKIGYTTLIDRRLIKNSDSSSSEEKWLHCGYRIYPDDGFPIPGQKWKFPWVGVWEPAYTGDDFTLAPEKNIYQKSNFFPLQTVQFQGFPVLIPVDSPKVLTSYFKTDNWMEFCVPPDLNHREYKKTHAPLSYLPVAEVMAYLSDLET